MKTYRLTIIPGDGIGNEVIPDGMHIPGALGQQLLDAQLETGGVGMAISAILDYKRVRAITFQCQRDLLLSG